MSNSRLINKVPLIKRARFFYIYSVSNKRYLDFYVNNGKNFLGHRVKGLNLILKQTFSRGLTASYLSVHKIQFEKMVFKYFNEADKVLVFKNSDRARKFLLDLLGDSKIKKPWEDKHGVYEFRAGFNNFQYPMLVDFPLPECLSLSAVFMKNMENRKIIDFKDDIDPFTLIVARHILSKLICYFKDVKVDFNVFKNPLFKIQNRYMFPLYREENHDKVFSIFLENGYLINPYYNEPSLAPFIFSKGDLDNFLKLAYFISNKL